MAETLRDLVVSLSLQTDNFTRNIKSVNKQIAEAESQFKLAASGVEGFERSATGLAAVNALAAVGMHKHIHHRALANGKTSGGHKPRSSPISNRTRAGYPALEVSHCWTHSPVRPSW